MHLDMKFKDDYTAVGEYADFQKRRAQWQSETQNTCFASFNGIDIIGVNAGVDAMHIGLFRFCKSLREIYISDSMREIGHIFGSNESVWQLPLTQIALERAEAEKGIFVPVGLKRKLRKNKRCEVCLKDSLRIQSFFRKEVAISLLSEYNPFMQKMY